MRVSKRVLIGMLISLLLGFALGYRVGGWSGAKQRTETSNYAFIPVRDTASGAQSGLTQSDWKKAFARIAKRAEPAVVHIRAVRVVADPFERLLYEFFGEPLPRSEGIGSGFIFRSDGYILTNSHVIEGARSIRVGLHDKSELAAKVVGVDPWLDLAVLKVSAQGPLPTLEFGDSDRVEVGDWAIAIGNPFGLGQTVTIGFINAKEREFESVEGRRSVHSYLQTSALINPGNSGGPLLDLNGNVIGINTFIYNPSGERVGIGIGFAIPINTVKALLDRLMKGGVVEHAYLGVVVENANDPKVARYGIKPMEGALILRVHQGSPAANAGLQAGDIIIRFNGKPIHSGISLLREVWIAEPYSDAIVEVVRGGQRMKFTVRLGKAQM
ncbi:MAG: trypsin-like peptidase domain-containing protein [Armatimonadota bacterium]|nr:trypsin-like peptidase domain-containing protein [Armatimonadota bacterium]MCX7776487.1 trypsin-like peptidase domain-containing protein [Armatimonadota bacterium]MDW8024284.1 trypsin-like peptidase domain-containing protein [Armatimonadota bacterium]